MSITRMKDMCEGVSSHKVLTTNWVTQTLFQAGEGAGFLVTGASGLCREHQVKLATIGSENLIGNVLPGLEIALGALSITRGVCQIYNTWHFDRDTQRTSSLSESISGPPKKEFYVKGILELVKGGFLVEYGYKALTQYQAGSTLSQIIPLTMIGFIVAAGIDTAVAIGDLMKKFIARYGIYGDDERKRNEILLWPEALNLLIQVVKLSGAILLFNSNPAGWAFLAAAGAVQLVSLLSKCYHGNIVRNLGFFPAKSLQQEVMREAQQDMGIHAAGGSLEMITSKKELSRKDAVDAAKSIMSGFTGGI